MGSQFANAAYNDNSTYSYDNTNQLAGADHSAIGDESYTYDANGNRTNTGYQTGTGNNNQLSSDGTDNYTYDNEGNLKTRTEIATGKVRSFTWDYRNRLTGVTDKTGGTVTQQVSYTYDALNQRLAKTVGSQTTRFVYDQGNVYLEFSGTNTTPSTRYLYGPMVDQVLAQESNGQTSWMLSDHLGSVRDLVNNSGTVVNHLTYDSFGQVVGSTGTVDTRYKFTGREYDSETGLYYYRARYFDAGVGRFIGQDPLIFGGGDSNLYRYVGNSSVNSTDPTGLIDEKLLEKLNQELRVCREQFGNNFKPDAGPPSPTPKLGSRTVYDDPYHTRSLKDDPYGWLKDFEQRMHLFRDVYKDNDLGHKNQLKQKCREIEKGVRRLENERDIERKQQQNPFHLPDWHLPSFPPIPVPDFPPIPIPEIPGFPAM